MRNLFITILTIISTSSACTKQVNSKLQPVNSNNNIPVTDTLTYLALGDSYTIGESVPQAQSFPYQLAQNLRADGHAVTPDIIAVTGWTTANLKAGITSRNLKNHNYNIVTLLIGVNNQYRGLSQTDYRAEFAELLNTAIAYAGGNKKHVFVVSIPDWGVTPFADGRQRMQIAAEIDAFNAINKQETEKQGVSYIDITPTSRRAGYEVDLTAEDGLHPSGKMYGLWVNQLAPVVKQQLGK